MLDLEGTRNERAVVIIASYIIGFVSAYIWFGASVSLAPDNLSLASNDGDPAAFTAAESEQTAQLSSVTYEDGLLEFHTNEESKLLSVASHRAQDDGSGNLRANGGQGVHEDVTSFLISKSGKFVFFCENYGDANCTGYIYDVVEDIIRPIRTQGSVATFSEQVARNADFTTSGLTVGEFHSSSAETPWLLTR